MKKYKKLLASLLAMAMVLACVPVYGFEAKAASWRDYAYTVNEDGISVTITGFKANGRFDIAPSDVVIPEEISGKKVTRIGNYAFEICDLTSITIPSSVTSIEEFAFVGYSSLRSIKVEEGNANYDSRENCNAIIKTESNELIFGCETTVIPSSVTRIGDYAFSGCSGLTGIAIPSSVTRIGDYAFSGCRNLAEITISSGLINIGDYAFSECSSLTSVVIPSSVTSIGDSAFERCSNLREIAVPSSVTNIGRGTFNGCSNLTEITLPSSMTSIGWGAFNGCSSLTEVIIPSSMTSIGDNAFSGCSSLTSITIPSGVTSIGEYAFDGCSSLTGITIPSGLTSIGLDAFWGCSSLESMKVEEGNEKYDSRGNCNAIIETENNELILGCRTTIIPSSVTSIGSNAFQGCSGLTEIAIPSSVTSIGWSAFVWCGSLTRVTIPPSVTSIGSSTFEGCSSLKEIIIPASVTSIGGDAFRECSSLTEITIPSNVTRIGNNAFEGCSSLTEIIIPASVTRIGWDAFVGCNENFVIYGFSGSEAEAYANDYGLTFNVISDNDLHWATLTLEKDSYTYDGTAKTPSVTVKLGEKTLNLNEDYTVAYSNNINVGTAKVTVTGKGGYQGSAEKTFTITKADDSAGPSGDTAKTDISKAAVELEKSSYIYDGKAKTPSVTVKLDGKTLALRNCA